MNAEPLPTPPKKEPVIQVNIRSVPQSLWIALRTLAVSERRSVSSLTVEAIKDYLQKRTVTI